MATNKKTIEFTAKNVKNFTNWLKRFSIIDNSLLLEIDPVDLSFIAKTYNEERSVVKMSSIKFDDAGLLTKSIKDTKRIKIGIFNIPRLTKIIDQFNDAEFTMTIEYQEIISEKDSQYAAEKILLKNSFLKMSVDCTSLNIFKYISDELFTKNIATIDIISSFKLSKSNLEKISVLNNLDNENRFMLFKFKEGKINVSGKTYDLLIEEKDTSDTKLSIFKDQFISLDTENYIVNMGDDRLVFTSSDSNTIIVISKAEDKD